MGEGNALPLMFLRNSLSIILDGVQRSEIGLYEAGSVRDLLSFGMGTIFDVFQR